MDSETLINKLNEYMAVEDYLEAIYFKGGREVPVKHRRPKTIEGFLLFSKIPRKKWYKLKLEDEFEEVCDLIELTIEEEKISYALLSIYNAPFVAKDLRVGEENSIEFGTLPPPFDFNDHIKQLIEKNSK